MKLQEEFKKFMHSKGLKQAHVARSIGVSPSAISTWLKGEYKGDNKTLEDTLSRYMRNYSEKESVLQEGEEIKPLSNLKHAHFVMDEAVVGSEMVALYGKPGSGKSVAVREWVKEHPEAILIDVVPGIRVNSLLKKIANRLGIGFSNSTEENIDAIAKEFKRRDAVLIIDEAEHLSTNSLEAIRRIYDFSEVPVVLVGTHILVKNLKGQRGELLQLYSRISGRWEFRELSEDDFGLLFGDVAKRIKKHTTHLRRASKIYKKALRFAQLKREKLNNSHIDYAAQMVFLD